MDLVSAAILGLVQGITEFLPVSSTGHLILAHDLIGADGAGALAFDAVLQLGTIGAVVVYFHKDLWLLLQAVLRIFSRLPVNPRDLTLIKALILGTIPAVILGLLLEDLMETAFRNPLLVAGVLVLGSIFFMFAEYIYEKQSRQKSMSAGMGFKIGLFQSLALIPGFSRSGASLAGGMMLGLSRSEATRFAFLLAIPIITGSGAKKLLEFMSGNASADWTAIGVGSFVAFLTGLIAIHFMITFVKKYSLWPFIWYRILLAAAVVLYTIGGN